MSYGLTIINNDDRIQIDDKYIHLYPTSETPNFGTTYSASGSIASDLIVAKARTGYNDSVTAAYYPNPNPRDGMYWHYLRKFAGNAGNPGGYGLNIKDAAGNALFYATSANKSFDIVATGVVPPSTLLYYPSSTGSVPDLDKYWVVINNTYRQALNLGPGGSVTLYFEYYYTWLGGTSGRISMFHTSPPSGVDDPPRYMILKEQS